MKRKLFNFTCGMLAALVLSGCVAAIGNRGNRDAYRASGVTLGQQLIDLQKAKESGAMTEQEYQAEKARMLSDK